SDARDRRAHSRTNRLADRTCQGSTRRRRHRALAGWHRAGGWRPRRRTRCGDAAPDVSRAVAALIGVLCAVIALTAAPTASAHATRIATDPAVDAVLDSGPSAVSATFNEQLQTAYAAMTV